MDNVEQKFGGTAPDVIIGLPNSLFPPRMPSSFFLKEEEDPNQILISEDEYIQMVENKKIREDCISPYIKETLELRLKQKNFELQLKQYIHEKDWKFKNEFEGKNKIKNLNKCKNNFALDIKTFNALKYNFHKSINILNDNK